jgi:hypothetical protein
MEPIDVSDLLVLNCWRDGTVGWHKENQLISLLNELCKEFGYGRVPQLANAIEDIWRHPEKREIYLQQRKQRLEDLAEADKWLEAHKDDPE